MKVFVNNQSIDLHYGATLKHALLKTNEKLYHEVIKGESIIRDHEGNETYISGAVAENVSYFVVKKEDNS
ncbi:hypothetical protein [Halalkalibacter alkalisediminis]|uniref:Uncharacterized protein n=1 Tax=Halalkalibacter alkalisediminis TaxID=935616 RepID=A0ABV6NGE2_9BACI|nr:hypothetical protein [Halalkalibacter alkalisediminis]